jgi:cation diffusion facilitator family transporter
MDALSRAGLTGVLVAGVILALRLAAWLTTHSAAVLADTLDPVFNLVAATVTLAAVRLSRRPADEARPFGYHKIEFVTVGVQGAVALAGAAVVTYAAWYQLHSGGQVRATSGALALFAVSIFFSHEQSRAFARVGREHASPALLAAAGHARTDVLVGLGVLANLVIVGWSGWYALDAAVSLLLAAIVAFQAARLLQASALGLLDTSHPEVHAAARLALEAEVHDDLIAFHDLRGRDAGGHSFFEFHLQFAPGTSLETAHILAEHAESAVEAAVGAHESARGADAIAHLETADQCRADRGHQRRPITDRERRRRRAATVAVIVAVSAFATKMAAARVTHSAAVLSDALESIANVAAASFLLYTVRLARSGSDQEHPWGHGKIEFLAAGFESALIGLAAVAICLDAAPRLLHGAAPEHLGAGLGLIVLAASANALLGWYLVRTGRQLGSLALEADGRHALSDVRTDAGAVTGLLIVRYTGWLPADPLIALLIAVSLAVTASRLGTRALRGVLDSADAESFTAAATALDTAVAAGRILGWHKLRVRDAAARRFLDVHVQFAEGTSLVDAHGVSEEIEDELEEALAPAEAIVHAEPAGDLA